MDALSFTFVHAIFIHLYLLSNSVIISSKKDDIDTSLNFPSRTSRQSVKGFFFYFINNKNKCVSFKFTKLISSNEL